MRHPPCQSSSRVHDLSLPEVWRTDAYEFNTERFSKLNAQKSKHAIVGVFANEFNTERFSKWNAQKSKHAIVGVFANSSVLSGSFEAISNNCRMTFCEHHHFLCLTLFRWQAARGRASDGGLRKFPSSRGLVSSTGFLRCQTERHGSIVSLVVL